MKATITFILPKDQEEYDNAYKANGMAAVLDEMDNWLREKNKYQSDSFSNEALAAYQDARDTLLELRQEYGC